MRVLWVNNIAVPEVAVKLGLPVSNREGWITGMIRRMTSGNADGLVDLAIAFPVPREQADLTSTVRIGNSDVRCYGFYEDLVSPEKVTSGLDERFKKIIEDFKPDLLHVFGTEFYHAASSIKAFGRPERTLVGLQGMMRAYESVYMGGLSPADVGIVTLRDFLKRDSLKMQKTKFAIRADHEAEALLLTKNVTGRTAFDKTEALKINPSLNYYHMNETMRESFYSGSWNEQECFRHSIFVSQGYYPIKGLHFMLEAMPLILEEYPDAVLRVAGDDVVRLGVPKRQEPYPPDSLLTGKKENNGVSGIIDRLKISGYGRYLRRLIKKNGLQYSVEMTGPLDEREMKEEYMRANVYVCPSAIENSPNSLGEAMLLGVPCVASEVGGIPDMLDSGREGILVPFGNVQALADAVKSIFEQSAVTRLYSLAAKKRAHITHDPESNFRRLIDIYKQLTAQ